jgi:hypothetical protein
MTNPVSHHSASKQTQIGKSVIFLELPTERLSASPQSHHRTRDGGIKVAGNTDGERQPSDRGGAQVMEVKILIAEAGTLDRLTPEAIPGPRLAVAVAKDGASGLSGRCASSIAFSGAARGMATCLPPLPWRRRLLLPSYYIHVWRIRSACRWPVRSASTRANLSGRKRRRRIAGHGWPIKLSRYGRRVEAPTVLAYVDANQPAILGERTKHAPALSRHSAVRGRSVMVSRHALNLPRAHLSSTTARGNGLNSFSINFRAVSWIVVGP